MDRAPPPKKEEENDGGHIALAHRDTYNAANEYDVYEAPNHQINGFVRSNEYLPVAVSDQNLNHYTQMDQYPYPEPSGTHFSTDSNMTGPYGSSQYPVNLASQALSSSYQHQAQQGVSGVLAAMYAPPIPGYHSVNNYGTDSGSWLQYPQTMPNNIGPHDYNPASALLQLGGRGGTAIGGEMNAADVAGGFDTSGMSGGAGQMWPMGVLDQGRGSH